MTKNTLPRGVICALATPLTPELKLDRKALAKLLEMQLAAGVSGIFILGSVGEGPFLPQKARQEIIQFTAKFIKKTVPIYCGVMDTSVPLILEKLELAAKYDCDAAVVTLPYYGVLDQQKSIHEFLEQLALKTPIPLIMYNLPRVTHVDLAFSEVRLLCQLKSFIALKDTRQELAPMQLLAADKKRRGLLSYLPGNSYYAAELLEVGADGVVSVFCNLFPSLLTTLYSAHLNHDIFLRNKCAEILKRLCAILLHPTTTGGIKCALELLNIAQSQTVPPWPRASKKDASKIRQILRETRFQMNKLGLSV